ncbi:MAG: hypothetical protein ABFD81_18270 [Syntrophaceae bacterium]
MEKIARIIVGCLLAAGVSMSSCQKADAVRGGEGKSGIKATSAVQPEPAKAGAIMRLKKYSLIDSQGTGGEAFSLLIPVDWHFEGGVTWVLDNPTMPATARFAVTNPAGYEGLEVFPNQALFWTNNRMLLGMFPIGSRYFGAEVHPVLGPEEALSAIVLPRMKAKQPGIKVIGSKSLPELAKALKAGAPQSGVQTFGQAAKVRIEYMNMAGVAMEEDIFAVVEGFSYPIQTMQGVITNTNWYVDYIFSFKAPKGKLDQNAPLFKAMTDSFRVNPGWFNAYNQVIDMLVKAQLRQIRSMGELSRYISQTNNEISDSMMRSYNERQKVYDRIGEKVSESIRGTEHYYNPIEASEVELPGGYQYVWTNPSGEYILTDSPGYNPNVESNKNWQEIRKK